MDKLKKFLVNIDNSMREVMACINRNASGIALVVDKDIQLINTVTDGDIRRSILLGMNLDTPIDKILNLSNKKPVTASIGTERDAILDLMQEKGIHQMPLLDDNGCVVELITLDDLLPNQTLPLQAMIMAGGYGTRLHPLTQSLPKPLLPIGDRPIMEFIITQLRQTGIRRVNISTHFESEKIIEHFGDGNKFGVEINYVTESSPLGTAGAVGLMEPSTEPLLVINGDILTQVNFKALLSYHKEHGADITVAVRKYDLKVPYGVIKCNGSYVQEIDEKPEYSFFINAGIYLLQPTVRRYIPNGQCLDMTDLIKLLIQDGRSVASFPVVEYWLDIGQHADYKQAKEDLQNGGLFTWTKNVHQHNK